MYFYLSGQLLEASIRPDTSILSVMTVNNEIGVRQPIEEIGNHGVTHMFLTRDNKENSYINIPVFDLLSWF